tara:strand:- start:85 stop:378 length:294 start_codon:yes stop_codon:yes gene_type:complete
MSFSALGSFRTRPLVDGGQAVHCWRGLADSMHRYGLLQHPAIDAEVAVTPERAETDHAMGSRQARAAVPLHGAPGIADADACHHSEREADADVRDLS